MNQEEFIKSRLNCNSSEQFKIQVNNRLYDWFERNDLSTSNIERLMNQYDEDIEKWAKEGLDPIDVSGKILEMESYSNSQSHLSCNSTSDSIAREVAEVLVEKHNWTSMETALNCCKENIDKIDKLYQRGWDLEHVAKEFDRLEGYSSKGKSLDKEVVDYIRKNTVKKNKYGDRLVKTENGKYFMAAIKDNYPYVYGHKVNDVKDGSYAEFGYGVEVSTGIPLSKHWEDMKSGKLPEVLVPEDYLGPINK